MKGIHHDGQDYSVMLTAEEIGGDEEHRSFLGITQEAKNAIVIDGTMPESRQEEVFLHELLHVADMSVPEFAIFSLSHGLYGILSENGLLKEGFLKQVVEGTVTVQEMAALNRISREIAEQSAPLREAKSRFAVVNKPWNGDASRYTIEEWRAACLIHLDGDQELKGTHKLPVREPDGDINLNACHAAAAVLGGARGGVDAPAEKKRVSARALVRIYRNDLEEEPPEGMMEMAGM